MRVRFTSCQAPNAEGHVSQIVDYLGERLGVDLEFVGGRDWQAREAALYAGDIQAGWICGLPYVVEADKSQPVIELLAAPVMAGDRYDDQPVYFSDVIVQTGSPVQEFADLRGRTWVYNEPHSHSGYNITRYMLATKGLDGSFFGARVEAGSHERALRLMLRGEVDATALDSTVLETELRNDPSLASRMRIIERWGPSPIPPWVIHRSLDKALAAALRTELLGMHSNAIGRKLLAAGGMSRFAEADDSAYDPIREMHMAAKHISL